MPDSPGDGSPKGSARRGNLDPGLTAHLLAGASAARDWVSDSIGLILLDGQLAGVSLIRMLVYGIVAALLLVTGWLALMLGLGFLLSRAGIAIEWIAFGVAVLSLLTGGLLIRRITGLSENITFRSTRDHLRSRSESAAPDDPMSPPAGDLP